MKTTLGGPAADATRGRISVDGAGGPTALPAGGGTFLAHETEIRQTASRSVATVGDIIERLFPLGTREAARTWDQCPDWPPDAFAVAATLVEASGCYAKAGYSARDGGGVFGAAYRRRVSGIARQWQDKVFPPPGRVQKLWDELVRSWGSDVCTHSEQWADAAMELLAVSDQCCAGIGFVHEAEASGVFETIVVLEHYNLVARRSPQYLPDVHRSLCMRVPTSEACVQPKSRTAQVGCTLRSFSHHLALLPSIGTVECLWHQIPAKARRAGPLRLLVVPYPYRVGAGAFKPGRCIRDGGSRSREFTVAQTWLPSGDTKTQAAAVTDFLLGIVREAEKPAPVHGLVLPELALHEDLAAEVARRLARRAKLEMFIAGVVSRETRGGLVRNEAYSTLFFGRQMLEWNQSKHHRWRIEAGQVERYGLSRLGKSARVWWEAIDISSRKVRLHVFRPGATLAVLVCEDLARHDPVQPVLRAIGPNLVIALLMDGAQLMSRWPGQYATVLSDDPGSSVLTVTSLGMVRRSVRDGSSRPMPVALWRQPWRKRGDEPRELALTQGGHALLLTLETVSETNWTLDGRGDGGNTVGLDLVRVQEIVHPAPPAWI